MLLFKISEEASWKKVTCGAKITPERAKYCCHAPAHLEPLMPVCHHQPPMGTEMGGEGWLAWLA